MSQISLWTAEIGLLFAAAAWVWLRPDAAKRWADGVAGRFDAFARHRAACVVLVAVFPVAARLALLPISPVPAPEIHDEFSYLLAADTFLHGRIANPTHSLWPHFETFHVTQSPIYASMYPPGQGLVLALGTLLGGHPWAGVLLSVALMCGAVCWALQGLFPARWAFAGACIFALRVGTFDYFGNSYRGGALAAAGGALLVGAAARLVRGPIRVRHALLCVLGLGLLVNTRPYEGTLLAAPVCGWMLFQIVRKWPRVRGLGRAAVPAACALVILGVSMLYYNWCAFGNALTLPYQLNRRQYAVAGVFYWQPLSPAPEYRHAVMRKFYEGWEAGIVAKRRGLAGFLQGTASKIARTAEFYLSPALLLSCILFPAAVRDRRLRVAAWSLVLVVPGALAQMWWAPHYAAPASIILWLLVVQSMRRLSFVTLRNRPVGGVLAAALPVICAAVFVVHAQMLALNSGGGGFGQQRSQLASRLSKAGGKHLIVVRYRPDHDVHSEWVYNAADIDATPVVWAREMAPADNNRLCRYYADRTIWLLQADEKPPLLQPYAGPGVQTASAAAGAGQAW